MDFNDFTHTDATSHLVNEQKEKYIRKLKTFNITDPYSVPQVCFNPLNKDSSSLPDTGYYDVYNYLVRGSSFYSENELKAYKSLDAYRYFESGYVMNPLLWCLPQKQMFIIMSKVSRLTLFYSLVRVTRLYCPPLHDTFLILEIMLCLSIDNLL